MMTTPQPQPPQQTPQHFAFLNEVNLDDADRATLCQLAESLNDPARHPSCVIPRTYLLKGPAGCGKTRLALKLAQAAPDIHLHYVGDTHVPSENLENGCEAIEYASVEELFTSERMASKKKDTATTIILLDDVLEVTGDAHSALAITARETRASLKRLIDLVKQMERVFLIATANNDYSMPEFITDRFDERMDVMYPGPKLLARVLSSKFKQALKDSDANANANANADGSLAGTFAKWSGRGTDISFRDAENIVRSAYTQNGGKPVSPKEVYDIMNTQYIASRMDSISFENMKNPGGKAFLGLPDLVGMEEQKRVISCLRNWREKREKLESMGVRIPPRFIFAGPPGTGKTVLARAIAREFGMGFKTVSATSVERGEFKYILMELDCDCLIFVDEADKILNPGNHHNDITLAGLQGALDGANGTSNAVLILSANRLDNFTPAFLSRFKIVQFHLPKTEDRREFFKRKLAMARKAVKETTPGARTGLFRERTKDSSLLEELTELSKNYSFRDMELLWSETLTATAGLLSAKKNYKVGIDDFRKTHQQSIAPLLSISGGASAGGSGHNWYR